MVEWPKDDEDFRAVVGQAMGDRKSDMAARVRDALGEPTVVGRTVGALEQIIDSMDAQLESSWSEDHTDRTTRARDRMLDRLVWYRTVASMGAGDDG